MREGRTRQTAAPNIGETDRRIHGVKTLQEQRPRNRNCCRNMCQGRKIWNTSVWIAGGSVLTTLELNIPEDPVIFWDLPAGAWQILTVKMRERLAHFFPGEEMRKTPFLNMPRHSVLNKACPHEKLVNQILTCWGLIRAYLPSSLPGGRREIPTPVHSLPIPPS